MAINPHQLDLWSSQVGHLYQSLEGEILKLIIQTIMDHGIENIETWQVEQLRDLRMLNQEVTKLLADLTATAEPDIREKFEQTKVGAVKEIDTIIGEETQIPTRLDNVMRGYYNQAWLGIDNLVNQTLVSTNYGAASAVTQAYTKTLTRVSALFNTGILTQEQAVLKAVQELAQRGIQSRFIDRGGNSWSLERYTRTVMKSTLGNTYDEVRKERMEEAGLYTVVVTSHAGARAECARIQGNVVDLRLPSEIPEDAHNYKSIYDPSWAAAYGEPGGHRGINCRHNHIPFIPGVNTNNQPKFDAKLNRKVAQAQTRQRQLERRIVKYKKNLMVSREFGAEDISHWEKMVLKSEEAIEKHLEENGEYLSRNHEREEVYTPLDTLLQEYK